VWASKTLQDVVPFEAGAERGTAAAQRALALDSTDGSAWANLAILRALGQRDLSAGTALMQRASRVDPSNAEVFMVASSMYRLAWRWDEARDAIRVARALDPLSAFYLEKEALVELCADRPVMALRAYESELTLSPAGPVESAGRIRTLARLGRYDEAIAAWRRSPTAPRDPASRRALDNAQGARGYWAVRHLEGADRLRAIASSDAVGYKSVMALLRAQFAAGDTTAGYATLATAEREGVRKLYHLPCLPDLDEVRGSPHFAAELARIGQLPGH
jgi:tetratricopeptide (TPR) repeat protein